MGKHTQESHFKTINGRSIFGSGSISTDDIVVVTDNLTSTSTTSALSAKQGKVLNDTKQAVLNSGSNIKTINGTSLLGSGDIVIPGSVFGTLGTFSKSFLANEIHSITLAGNVTTPVVQVTKSVPQSSVLDDTWMINTNANDYVVSSEVEFKDGSFALKYRPPYDVSLASVEKNKKHSGKFLWVVVQT